MTKLGLLSKKEKVESVKGSLYKPADVGQPSCVAFISKEGISHFAQSFPNSEGLLSIF